MSGLAPDDAERLADARLRRWCYGIYVGIWAMALSIAFPPTPRFVWNVSSSVPRGLYRVHPGANPGRGDIVVANMLPAMRDLAATRHYLPAGVPLVKPVAAVAGDRLCAEGRTILVNGHRLAERLIEDQAGRTLPAWQGCRTLRDGEVFLLSTASPDSFDGRYFGVTRRDELAGKAVLIWRR